MKTQYDLEKWAAETTRGRQVFNFNFRMLGTEIKNWKLLKVVTLQEDPDTTARTYIWQSARDPEDELVRVDITERHTWQRAQESLHNHLVHCMRSDIPRGTKSLAQLGDVVFASREPKTDSPGAISFARGNVCVTLSSVGAKHVDVSEVAALLDRILSEPPPAADVEKGRARAHVPKLTTLKARRSVTVIDKLPKAVPRGGWLKVIAPDGELSRKGDALLYVSPEGGKKSIATYLMRGT